MNPGSLCAGCLHSKANHFENLDLTSSMYTSGGRSGVAKMWAAAAAASRASRTRVSSRDFCGERFCNEQQKPRLSSPFATNSPCDKQQ